LLRTFNHPWLTAFPKQQPKFSIRILTIFFFFQFFFFL
jgi:hypothetical protein